VKAALLSNTRDLEIVTLDRPAPKGDEVLVAVRACGVCGSDVLTYSGEHPFRFPPVVLGHEIAGEVVAVGPDVAHTAVGDRVAVMPLISCWNCRRCHHGMPQWCEHRLLSGVGCPGHLSEFVVSPERTLFAIGDRSFEEGAMIEPITVAHNALRVGGMRPGLRVAVLGAGGIGSVIGLLAAKGGARTIMMSDVKDFNLDLMRQVIPGVETVNAAQHDVVAAGKELTGGRGFDLVLQASGHPAGITEACNLTTHGGVAVLLPMFHAPMTFDANDLVTRGLQLRGAVLYTPKDFGEVSAMMAAGQLDVSKIITHRVALDEAPDVFARIHDGFDHIKVMFEIDGTRELEAVAP
jgi:L-iditol 2-dehydrogenase